jgi:shikimate kinase
LSADTARKVMYSLYIESSKMEQLRQISAQSPAIGKKRRFREVSVQSLLREAVDLFLDAKIDDLRRRIARLRKLPNPSAMQKVQLALLEERERKVKAVAEPRKKRRRKKKSSAETRSAEEGGDGSESEST